MGSCPDGEAVRGGGMLTARERQAPEKRSAATTALTTPAGRIEAPRRRRKGSGGQSGRRRRSGAGSAEVRNEPEMNLHSDGAERR